MADTTPRFTHCAYCDKPLPWDTGPGRPKKYCKRSHRQRHYEASRRGFTAQEIAERDGWKCYLCGAALDAETVELDHIDPISKGGRDATWNVAACCKPCNVRKAAHGYWTQQGRLPL